MLFLSLQVSVSASNNATISDYSDATQAMLNEEPVRKSGHSLKAYSTGTIYKKSYSSIPPIKRQSENTSDDDDPGFPGDPGNLPAGDGFVLLFVSGIIYFIVKGIT